MEKIKEEIFNSLSECFQSEFDFINSKKDKYCFYVISDVFLTKDSKYAVKIFIEISEEGVPSYSIYPGKIFKTGFFDNNVTPELYLKVDFKTNVEMNKKLSSIIFKLQKFK